MRALCTAVSGAGVKQCGANDWVVYLSDKEVIEEAAAVAVRGWIHTRDGWQQRRGRARGEVAMVPRSGRQHDERTWLVRCDMSDLVWR